MEAISHGGGRVAAYTRVVVVVAAMCWSMTGCAGEGSAPAFPNGVDHLVFGVRELKAGMDYIEQLLGTRPVMGGRHPWYGTHNAVIALGPTTYLEIIAPDPVLARPDRGRPFGLESVEESRLVTWAVRNEKIDTIGSETASVKIGIGPVESGSRERPDGAVLKWRLTDPYAMPLDGAIPFLIHWGDTPHPASAAPDGGRLVGLRIHHPEPERVRESLAALGIIMHVMQADEFELAALIQTPSGIVELR